MQPRNSERHRVRTAMAIVFGAALAARGLVFYLGPLQERSRAIAEDSAHYVTLAQNLATTGQFAMPLGQQTPMHKLIVDLRERVEDAPVEPRSMAPESFRTPGYPAFIAVASLGMRDLGLVTIAQCLLGAMAASMVFLLASYLGFSTIVSMVSGFVWALHPALVVFDNLILTEGLFNFCVVLATLLAASATSTVGLLAAGTVLGCATLVRPPLGLFYIPVMLALAWQRFPRRLPLVMATLCALGLPGLWTIRNVAVGEGARFSTVGDYSLIFYTAPCAVSETLGEDCDRAYPRRHAEIAQRLRNELKTGDNVLAVARRDAVTDLLANSTGAVRMYAKSLVKLAVAHSMGTFATVLGLPYQSSGLFSKLVLREGSDAETGSLWPLLLAAAWTFVNVAIVLAALVGLAMSMRVKRFDFVLGFGLTAALFVASVGAVGQERTRLPIMVSLLMFGALALSKRKD